MQTFEHKSTTSIQSPPCHTILELTVTNHPGVMSHVCGLFSRRAYNMEGILCVPLGNDQQSRIWLRVNEEERLAQIIAQLQKLEDILKVRCHGVEHEVSVQLTEFFRE